MNNLDDLHWIISNTVCHAAEVKDVEHIIEEYLLSAVMEKFKYNQSRVALELGISRTTLRQRLKKHFGTKYFRNME